MMFLHDFHFLRPYFLVLLPLLWGVTLWLARRHHRDRDWRNLIDAKLLSALRLDAVEAKHMSPWPLLALTWSLATLALAGPSWQQNTGAAFRLPAAWIFVLDLSPSMKATDVVPNRVARARYALDDMLGAARDTRVALMVFSDDAYTVTPLTQDVATVRTLLPPLTPEIMPSPGNNLAPALIRADRLLTQSGAKDKRIVLLTDGFDDPAAALSNAARLKSDGVMLDVVGTGTAGGSPLRSANGQFVVDANGHTQLTRLDAAALRQLAETGGGRYFDMANLPSLIEQLQSSTSHASDEIAIKGAKVSSWRDAGVYLLPLLLLAAALLGRRGWL